MNTTEKIVKLVLDARLKTDAANIIAYHILAVEGLDFRPQRKHITELIRFALECDCYAHEVEYMQIAIIEQVARDIKNLEAIAVNEKGGQV